MKFSLKLRKKSNAPPMIEITPDMKGVKSVQYFMGKEIDYEHPVLDIGNIPVAVMSYFSEGADTIYAYLYNKWEMIGSKKLFE